MNQISILFVSSYFLSFQRRYNFLEIKQIIVILIEGVETIYYVFWNILFVLNNALYFMVKMKIKKMAISNSISSQGGGSEGDLDHCLSNQIFGFSKYLHVLFQPLYQFKLTHQNIRYIQSWLKEPLNLLLFPQTRLSKISKSFLTGFLPSKCTSIPVKPIFNSKILLLFNF